MSETVPGLHWLPPPGSGAQEIVIAAEEAIQRGELTAGDRLPTIRELAVLIGVSTSTVAKAYRILAERTMVHGSGRGGTVVNDQVTPSLRRSALFAQPGLINLADGNPDPELLPPLDATAAAGSAASLLYSADPVLPELERWARASFLADNVQAERIIVASGALDGIELALGARLRPGDRVAVEDPAHCGLLDLLEALRHEAVGIRSDAHGMLPDSLAKALSSGVAAVVITPRVQNPTGSALDADRAAELAAVITRHPNVLLVENDHAALIADIPLYTLTGSARSWVAIRSMSKALGPDLRLAVLAADPTTLAALERRQQAASGWVSRILQRIVTAQVSDSVTQKQLAVARSSYTRRRSALIGAIAKAGLPVYGESGYNVWIELPAETTVVQGLQTRGWAVRPGESFRLTARPGIRVTASRLRPADAGRFASHLIETLSSIGSSRTA